jgi:TolB-like protein
MKRCPECRRDYYDETLLYCLDDGAALLEGPSSGASQSDESATAILNSEAPTRVHTTPTQTHDATGTTIPSTRKYITAGLIGVLIVTALGVGSYWLYRGRAGRQISSIAVMPFVNQSSDPSIDYLSDGMTEELISSLTQLPDLGVKPRSTVFRYKGKDSDAKTIGTELDVEAILTATIVQRGSDLTLHVELIDTASETLLWSTDYKRPVANLAALQNEIARDVVEKLHRKRGSISAIPSRPALLEQADEQGY